MLHTTHRLILGAAGDLAALPDASVHLVVTSPPYPMIAMWDAGFSEVAPIVSELLAAGKGPQAFEAMHRALDPIWAACSRVLVPGGFACINIGDATRTLGPQALTGSGGEFCFYPNHARIVTAMLGLGLTPLPDILWRKPNNSPNKFMGSGMLPAGAYVTYEHEYILIFRKGGKRTFDDAQKAVRSRSAFFWEERNVWFSDIWTDLRGASQRLSRAATAGSSEPGLRERSAAFPFELPFRLVSMYSLQGETVLDPFAGTGTTLAAALAAGRSSVGYERESGLRPVVAETLADAMQVGRERVAARLHDHERFIAARLELGKEHKHLSRHYSFPVVTRQEVELQLAVPLSAEFAPAGVSTSGAQVSGTPASGAPCSGGSGDLVIAVAHGFARPMAGPLVALRPTA